MTDAQKNELTSLRVHEAAFAQSIDTMEARGGAHFTVLGMERNNLANIRAKIAEIEKAATPKEAPPETQPGE